MTAPVKPKQSGKWDKIIAEVDRQLRVLRGQGIAPTLRTMHYRLVGLNVNYGNTKNEYKELSRQTARAREDRRLPINCFVDQGREIVENGYMSDAEITEPEEWINAAIDRLENLHERFSKISLPKWYNQKHYVEIWLEKEALENTFKRALRGLAVRIVPNKGYSSLTFMWENCKRLQRVKEEEPDKKIHIRYFSDFDPSGDDMDRDIIERIERLTGWTEGIEFDFKRVAITRLQVRTYDLPPMPSDNESIEKFHRDPRRDRFVEKNGGLEYAVELDALTVAAPDDFMRLIQDCVLSEFYDSEIYEAELRNRSSPEFKKSIKHLVYEKLSNFLDGYDPNN